jgi:hypothetical protein
VSGTIERARAKLADLRGRGPYTRPMNNSAVLFIHIPKTGGTSISDCLFGEPSRHVPWSVYHSVNRKKFASYWKFAFVRNPWDRLLSAFTFLKRGGLNDLDRDFAKAHLSRFPDFESFVRDGLSDPMIRNWVHFRPQHQFVCDASGKNMMDFTGRFERLEDDFALIASRLGLDSSLPARNRGPRIDYRTVYPKELVEVVGDIYSEDGRIFGYTFSD